MFLPTAQLQTIRYTPVAVEYGNTDSFIYINKIDLCNIEELRIKLDFLFFPWL